MVSKLLHYIESNKEVLYETLCSFIRINTENMITRGTEQALARHLEAELKKIGIPSDVYSPDSVEGLKEMPDYLPGRNLEDRTNITGTIKGKSGKKALMLAAHLDTMPIGDLSLWTVPPTEGIIKDGKIWGRGACDDKYALAAWFMIAKAIKELGIELENDLYLTGYVDEEYGGGDGALACSVKYPSDCYLNLDCKNFEIWNCASGGQEFEIVIKHTTHLDSCKKVFEGLEIAKKIIEEFGERRKAELKINPFYDGTIIPNTSLRFLKMGCGLNSNDMHVGSVKFVYYTDKDQEQINKEYNEMFDRINKEIAHLDLEIDKVNYISRFFRYGSTPADNENIVLLKEAGKKASGREIKACGSCLSDLSLFLANGKGVSYSFGIGRDFDAYGGAHQPDEYIECDKLLEYTKIIAQFVMDWDKKNS